MFTDEIFHEMEQQLKKIAAEKPNYRPDISLSEVTPDWDLSPRKLAFVQDAIIVNAFEEDKDMLAEKRRAIEVGDIVEQAHPEKETVNVGDAPDGSGIVENQNQQHQKIKNIVFRMPKGFNFNTMAVLEQLAKIAEDLDSKGKFKAVVAIDRTIKQICKIANEEAEADVANMFDIVPNPVKKKEPEPQAQMPAVMPKPEKLSSEPVVEQVQKPVAQTPVETKQAPTAPSEEPPQAKGLRNKPVSVNVKRLTPDQIAEQQSKNLQPMKDPDKGNTGRWPPPGTATSAETTPPAAEHDYSKGPALPPDESQIGHFVEKPNKNSTEPLASAKTVVPSKVVSPTPAIETPDQMAGGPPKPPSPEKPAGEVKTPETKTPGKLSVDIPAKKLPGASTLKGGPAKIAPPSAESVGEMAKSTTPGVLGWLMNAAKGNKGKAALVAGAVAASAAGAYYLWSKYHTSIDSLLEDLSKHPKPEVDQLSSEAKMMYSDINNKIQAKQMDTQAINDLHNFEQKVSQLDQTVINEDPEKPKSRKLVELVHQFVGQISQDAQQHLQQQGVNVGPTTDKQRFDGMEKFIVQRMPELKADDIEDSLIAFIDAFRDRTHTSPSMLTAENLMRYGTREKLEELYDVMENPQRYTKAA